MEEMKMSETVFAADPARLLIAAAAGIVLLLNSNFIRYCLC